MRVRDQQAVPKSSFALLD